MSVRAIVRLQHERFAIAAARGRGSGGLGAAGKIAYGQRPVGRQLGDAASPVPKLGGVGAQVRSDEAVHRLGVAFTFQCPAEPQPGTFEEINLIVRHVRRPDQFNDFLPVDVELGLSGARQFALKAG